MTVGSWIHTADPEMRASDEAREGVVQTLCDAYANGELDLVELRQRSETAQRARTLGELRELVADIRPRDRLSARGARVRGADALVRMYRWGVLLSVAAATVGLSVGMGVRVAVAMISIAILVLLGSGLRG